MLEVPATRSSARRSHRATLGFALLAACSGDPGRSPGAPGTLDATGALLPDTQTVNGVLVMHHTAAALDQVRELALDSVPAATFDEPTGTWDVSRISQWHAFTDGRMVAFSIIGNPGLMLFASDGRPERLLARFGEGPGDIGQQVWGRIVMMRDTLVVFDLGNQRISRFTASGFVDDQPWQASFATECVNPVGYLGASDRMVLHCQAPGAVLDRESTRPMRSIGVGRPGAARVVHTFPGAERRKVLAQTTAGMEMIWETLAFGRAAEVVPWDSMIVVAAQDRGFVLELRDTSGALRREFVVERPAMPVTAAMRDSLIALQVAAAIRYGAHGGHREGELERKAREQPFPDSLPPHGPIHLGTDGTLWVFDYLTETDSTWSAIGFRADGAIVGRLRGRGGKYHRPFWFGEGTALVREEDASGLVRWRMYRIVAVTQD